MSQRQVAREYLNGRLCRVWLKQDENVTVTSQATARPARSLHLLLSGAFLPEGYPASVTRDYAGELLQKVPG